VVSEFTFDFSACIKKHFDSIAQEQNKSTEALMAEVLYDWLLTQSKPPGEAPVATSILPAATNEEPKKKLTGWGALTPEQRKEYAARGGQATKAKIEAARAAGKPVKKKRSAKPRRQKKGHTLNPMAADDLKDS
jgi:hypothetical protein